MNLGQLAVMVGFIWYTLNEQKKRFCKMEREQIKHGQEIAVLKELSKDSKADHDKLILIEQQSKRAHERLDDFKNQRRD